MGGPGGPGPGPGESGWARAQACLRWGVTAVRQALTGCVAPPTGFVAPKKKALTASEGLRTQDDECRAR